MTRFNGVLQPRKLRTFGSNSNVRQTFFRGRTFNNGYPKGKTQTCRVARMGFFQTCGNRALAGAKKELFARRGKAR